MMGSTRYGSQTQDRYAARGDAERHGQWEILPGERISSPVGQSRLGSTWRGIVILIALGAAVTHHADPAIGPRLWSAVTAAASQVMERISAASAAPAAKSLPRPDPQSADADEAAKKAARDAPLPVRELEDSTPAAAPPIAIEKPAEPPAVEAASAGKVVEPTPAPAKRAASGDPHQKRAEAVGLHPDLSLVLLAQLSEVDFRNAGIAIRTAMAETDDDTSFIWPRQRKAELAQFKVHFVPGAAPNCRRYVVTVAKHGWLTTALPMEKCGVQRSASPGPIR